MTTLPTDREKTPMAGVLDRNIHAIVNKRKEEDQNLSWQDRLAQTVTKSIGSIRSVGIHASVFGLWGVCNLGVVHGLMFDPGFSILDVLISMEAIVLTIFVLINQNRMVRIDARHSDLNLQVSLLAEHEVTHLIQLVTAIAEKMELPKAKNPELDELQRGINPEQILEEIEIREDRAEGAADP